MDPQSSIIAPTKNLSQPITAIGGRLGPGSHKPTDAAPKAKPAENIKSDKLVKMEAAAKSEKKRMKKLKVAEKRQKAAAEEAARIKRGVADALKMLEREKAVENEKIERRGAYEVSTERLERERLERERMERERVEKERMERRRVERKGLKVFNNNQKVLSLLKAYPMPPQTQSNPYAALIAQMELLSHVNVGQTGSSSTSKVDRILGFQPHELEAAPLFTVTAKNFVDELEKPDSQHSISKIFPQYGLLAAALEFVEGGNSFSPEMGGGWRDPAEQRVYLNANAPLSTFICGLQGSGKSHTLTCMLENFLLGPPDLGSSPRPLGGVVFHFDSYTSASNFRPCEAAYLASHVPVIVLVSPSNLRGMEKLYASIPGAQKPIVLPLKLSQKDLNIGCMLSLMAVDKTDRPPLYMEYVRKILKDMEATRDDGEAGLDYRRFKKELENAAFSRDQKGPLNLRLEILESFLQLEEGVDETMWDLIPGTLTIVDLSDPFVDEGGACAMFDICLSLFLEKKTEHGIVIALDEAHKYMGSTTASERFTDTLLAIIRQQRHLGARVIIATQEPTISPRLLDLCTITVVHRFSSPEWFRFLKQHIASLAIDEFSEGSTSGLLTLRNSNDFMQRILSLNEGEAYFFVPSGICARTEFGPGMYEENEHGGGNESPLRKFGIGILKVMIRKRITEDGGKSLMAN